MPSSSSPSNHQPTRRDEVQERNAAMCQRFIFPGFLCTNSLVPRRRTRASQKLLQVVFFFWGDQAKDQHNHWHQQHHQQQQPQRHNHIIRADGDVVRRRRGLKSVRLDPAWQHHQSMTGFFSNHDSGGCKTWWGYGSFCIGENPLFKSRTKWCRSNTFRVQNVHVEFVFSPARAEKPTSQAAVFNI